MNFEFMCLIIIFVLLVLLITFKDCFNSLGLSYMLSTSSNNISSKSMINTLIF
jgi:hypothetical protein